MSDNIDISKKGLNLFNQIQISYGKLIDDNKENHIFDKRIKISIIRDLIPFVTSYFNKSARIEFRTDLYYLDLICSYKNRYDKEIYQNSITSYNVKNNQMVKEIDSKIIKNIVFPSFRKFDYQSNFILYKWDLDDGITIKISVFKDYGSIDLEIDVFEKVSILDIRKKKIYKRINELSKILSYFKVN